MIQIKVHISVAGTGATEPAATRQTLIFQSLSPESFGASATHRLLSKQCICVIILRIRLFIRAAMGLRLH